MSHTRDLDNAVIALPEKEITLSDVLEKGVVTITTPKDRKNYLKFFSGSKNTLKNQQEEGDTTQ